MPNLFSISGVNFLGTYPHYNGMYSHEFSSLIFMDYLSTYYLIHSFKLKSKTNEFTSMIVIYMIIYECFAIVVCWQETSFKPTVVLKSRPMY